MVDLPSPAPPAPYLTGAERLWAWLDLRFKDHGVFRDVYWNLHQVAPGVWRAAQPAPRHIARAREMGIGTILNLRGPRPTCGAYRLEREACARAGLRLIDFPIRSRSPLDRETMLAAIDLSERLEPPFLMHCKSGADRTGLFATIHLHVRHAMPMRDAMAAQLTWRYGHFSKAKTGVIDFVFERYIAQGERRGLAFRDWVANDYDPARLAAEFRDVWWLSVLTDRVLKRE